MRRARRPRSRAAGRTPPCSRCRTGRTTIVGPSSPASVARRASGRIRPWPSAATRWTRPRPRPSIWSETKIVTWASSPTTTLMAGASNRPRSSTSQPSSPQDRVTGGGERGEVGHRRPGREARTTSRPAVRAARRASRSATSSTTAAAGESDVQAGVLVPGAGQPVRRQGRRQATADDEAEVARAGGRHDARIRGPGQAPRSPPAAPRRPPACGPPSAARRAVRFTGPPTGRSPTPARKVSASSAVRRSSSPSPIVPPLAGGHGSGGPAGTTAGRRLRSGDHARR